MLGPFIDVAYNAIMFGCFTRLKYRTYDNMNGERCESEEEDGKLTKEKKTYFHKWWFVGNRRQFFDSDNIVPPGGLINRSKGSFADQLKWMRLSLDRRRDTWSSEITTTIVTFDWDWFFTCLTRFAKTITWHNSPSRSRVHFDRSPRNKSHRLASSPSEIVKILDLKRFCTISLSLSALFLWIFHLHFVPPALISVSFKSPLFHWQFSNLFVYKILSEPLVRSPDFFLDCWTVFSINV